MSKGNKKSSHGKIDDIQEEKRQVNDHQLEIYFQKYDRFWRLNKLISLRHLLNNREELRQSIRDVYGTPETADDQLIYGNLTSGILADATSELTMLCEDYFGLLRFTREPFSFIKKAVSYQAGKVIVLPKTISEPTDTALRKLFFVPSEEYTAAAFVNVDPASASDATTTLNERIGFLRGFHNDAVEFFRKHKDFHVQYKHGLKLALSGLHGNIAQVEIERRKTELSAPLFAFENKPITQLGYGAAMFIPDIGFPLLRKNLGQLHQDLDLLHIQLLHNIDINELIKIAKKIVKLNHYLISNRLSLTTKNISNRIKFLLPNTDEDNMQSAFYEFDVPPPHTKPTIFDYQLD